ncbi:unnamed protein product, partial [Ceratitis capitata]
GNIRDEATQNKLSSSQSKTKLVVDETSQRIVYASPNDKWTKLKSKLRLTAQHKQERYPPGINVKVAYGAVENYLGSIVTFIRAITSTKFGNLAQSIE